MKNLDGDLGVIVIVFFFNGSVIFKLSLGLK